MKTQQQSIGWPATPEGQDRLKHQPTLKASIQYWSSVLEESKQAGDWRRERVAFGLIESLRNRMN